MADNPITTPLPADLPEQWTYGQTVGPNGTDVGLTEQHGYNYLMRQVNATQEGVNALGEAFAEVPVLEGGKVPVSQLPVGTPNGVAGLDSAGKVPSSQLPDMDYVPLSGGTMTGPLVLPGDPTASLQAAPKQYVDNALNDITPSGIGAAPASHTHAATDITSGVLPLARGGTGGASAAAGLYQLVNNTTALTASGLSATDCFGIADVSAGDGKKLQLGQLTTYLFNNLGAARIQTGSYVGTGTYGSSNPCSLTFDFVPKMLFIAEGMSFKVTTCNLFSSFSTSYGTAYITWSANRVSWYADAANAQMNYYNDYTGTRTTYYYVAIG